MNNDGKMFGNLRPNGTYDGALGHLQTFQIDITFVGFFIKDYQAPDVEFVAPVYQDQLCCMTKKAGKVPAALLPLRIFETQLWFSLLSSYFVISISWCILRALNLRFMTRENFNLASHVLRASTAMKMLQVFIDSLVLIFSSPFRRFTKIQNERVLIASICLYSLIVIAAFQSSLATVYTNPMYYKNIETLEQLDASGMKIVSKYKGFLDDAFPPNSSELIDRLVKKTVWIENVNFIERLGKIREAGFTRKTTFDFSYKMKNFHLIRECPRKYRIAYVVHSGFAMLEELNVNILRLVAGGIVQKFINAEENKASLMYFITNRDTFFIPTLKVFALEDLQSSFFILSLGIVVAFLVFIVENMSRLKLVRKCCRRVS